MSLRIIVADGDSSFGKLLSNSLVRAGHDVTTVNSSAEAKTALGKNVGADVVFVDPDLLGSRVSTILSGSRAAKIFLCSSRSPEDIRLGELRAVAKQAEYLKKPFSILDLESRLRDVIEGARPEKTVKKAKKAGGRTGQRAASKITGQVRGVAPSALTPNADSSATLNRLEREWRELQNIAPLQVLGAPEGADFEMVQKAADRMNERYRVLANDQSQSAEVRSVANKISNLVQGAWFVYRSSLGGSDAKIVVEEAPPSHEAPESEEEQLLALGRRMIKAASWEEADRVLTRANQLDLAHPGILACLGWARLHNPALPDDERIEEGVEYLILAEQFGPREPEGLFYLSRALKIQGRYEAALNRAERLVRICPEVREYKDWCRGLTKEASQA